MAFRECWTDDYLLNFYITDGDKYKTQLQLEHLVKY